MGFDEAGFRSSFIEGRMPPGYYSSNYPKTYLLEERIGYILFQGSVIHPSKLSYNRFSKDDHLNLFRSLVFNQYMMD